jgi:hypothetical protein
MSPGFDFFEAVGLLADVLDLFDAGVPPPHAACRVP